MNELIERIRFKKIYFRDRVFDKKQLMEAVDKLADYFSSKIVSSSPFIVFTAYNHIKTAITFYAILKAGKIAVILDPSNKNIELTEVLEDVDPGAVVFLNESTMGFNYEEEIIFRNTNPNQKIESDLTDVCIIAYTNAEDGYSKGAMLTVQNILAEVAGDKIVVGASDDSVACAFLPFSHLFGLIQGLIVPTQVGGSVLIKEVNLFKLNELVLEFKQIKITHFYAVPFIYYLLSKVPQIDLLVKNVPMIISGGTSLPSSVYDTFYNKSNRKIREGYGLTECSPAIAVNYLTEPLKNSVGQAYPSIEIKIFDDNMNECNKGTKGEICVKGDLVFKGYFNDKDLTSKVFSNEWFHTGDYGSIDSNGNISYLGLKKNMINVAGNNVYPRKLERLMHIHENINSVNVFKEDSLLQGQSVLADIHLFDNSLKKQIEYKDWCKQNINNTLLPKKWNFI
jgi:long-chain acyl-CoA synthetase